MMSQDNNIKDINLLFKEISIKNPIFQNLNDIFNIYKSIEYYYLNNIQQISEESLKRKIKELKNKISSNIIILNLFLS